MVEVTAAYHLVSTVGTSSARHAASCIRAVTSSLHQNLLHKNAGCANEHTATRTARPAVVAIVLVVCW